jgi:hypothetical protein
MKKVNVIEKVEDIKEKLLRIKNEICIIHNRRTKDNFIVTFEKNLEFIRDHLSVISEEDFTNLKKIEFIVSDDSYLVGKNGQNDHLRPEQIDHPFAGAK